MNDHEMAALTAVVNAEIADVQAANAQRAHLGQSMAYDGYGVLVSAALTILTEELRRRGVLP